MATSVETGVNWSIEGSTFWLFGLKGLVSGKYWALPVSSLGGVLAEMDPSPLSPNIERIIQQDIACGNEAKIDFVGTTALGGLQLALEGLLTVEILRESEETPDSITVTIEFLGKPRKVVIYSPDTEPAAGVATYDASGQIV